MDLLDRSLGHDHWATSRMLELCGGLTDGQLDQEFDIGHRTLRDTLDHTIGAVAFWTGQMIGQPIQESRDDRSIAALTVRHERCFATFADVARQMRDDGRLEDTFIDHWNNRQSMGGTINHVILHNAQHRSEVRHILERLGVPDLWDYDPQEWEHATGQLPPA